MPRHILSLFDSSGTWSAPYRQAGYEVTQVDLSLGQDVRNFDLPSHPVHGILAAPPCTHFAASGAQYWPSKDRSGETTAAVELVYHTLFIIEQLAPVWWCLENPVGRLNALVPALQPFGPRYFQPWHYGDPWTKKTGLWGNFTFPAPTSSTPPATFSSQGSWTQALGSKSEATKAARSRTPSGFAYAFFHANP